MLGLGRELGGHTWEPVWGLHELWELIRGLRGHRHLQRCRQEPQALEGHRQQLQGRNGKSGGHKWGLQRRGGRGAQGLREALKVQAEAVRVATRALGVQVRPGAEQWELRSAGGTVGSQQGPRESTGGSGDATGGTRGYAGGVLQGSSASTQGGPGL